MKRTWIIGALVALLLVLGGAAPAAAGGQATQAVGFELTCAVAPGREWVSGNILHVRGQIATTRTVATDVATGLAEPRLTGTNTINLNINLNLETGRGTLHGSTTLQPDTVDGAWENTFTGTIRDGIITVRAVGRGTGELAGLKLNAELETTALDAAPPLCGGGELAASTIAWTIRP